MGDFIEDQKTASPEDEAAATMRREQIHQLLETLTEREKALLHCGTELMMEPSVHWKKWENILELPANVFVRLKGKL